MTGTNFLHVPYKGFGQMVIALIGGELQLAFVPISSVRAHVASGKVRALTVTTRARTGALPAVPTLSESGVTGYEAQDWVGLFQSKMKPPECKKNSMEIIDRSVRTREFRAFAQEAGFDIPASSPEQFEAMLKGESTKWARVIKAQGIKGE